MGVVLFGVSLTLLVATPFAYAMIRFRVRGGRWLRIWLLLAYTTPEFLFVIPMYVAYQQFGLYDTVIGVAIIYQVFAVPFAVWLIQSFLNEVPRELGDSARVDGASELQTLLRVYVPLAAPGLAATAILVGINMWNEVTIALALTFLVERGVAFERNPGRAEQRHCALRERLAERRPWDGARLLHADPMLDHALGEAINKTERVYGFWHTVLHPLEQ